MDPFDLIVAILGVTVLVLGLGSRILAESPLPPTLLALAFGVVIGPELLGWVDVPELQSEPLVRERISRLVLGVALMGVALRIPREFPRNHWRPVAVLAGPGMILMWAISTALVYFFLDISFWLAALIGAIITATDPVSASPIVTGRTADENIPDRLRHTISLESGANDGLSYLFVFLSFLMLTRPPEEAVSHWLVHTVLWEVGVATLFGLILGYAAAKLLRWAEDRDTIEGDWRLIYTVALALVATGAGRLIGSDELLVVFGAGVAFVQVASGEERIEEDRGQEAVDRFFAIPIFVLLGIAIPWDGWRALGWSGMALAAAVLLLRRPPVLLLLRPFISTVRNTPEALFVGWFGPISVAAIYYASLIEHRLGQPLVWHAVSLVVCASVLAHGVTGAPLTRFFGRRWGKRSGRQWLRA